MLPVEVSVKATAKGAPPLVGVALRLPLLSLSALRRDEAVADTGVLTSSGATGAVAISPLSSNVTIVTRLRRPVLLPLPGEAWTGVVVTKGASAGPTLAASSLAGRLSWLNGGSLVGWRSPLGVDGTAVPPPIVRRLSPC